LELIRHNEYLIELALEVGSISAVAEDIDYGFREGFRKVFTTKLS